MESWAQKMLEGVRHCPEVSGPPWQHCVRVYGCANVRTSVHVQLTELAAAAHSKGSSPAAAALSRASVVCEALALITHLGQAVAANGAVNVKQVQAFNLTWARLDLRRCGRQRARQPHCWIRWL